MVNKESIADISFHKILLILLEKGELNMTSLTKETRLCKQTVSNHVKWLIDMGIIKENRIKGLPPQRMIILTDQGKELALILHKTISLSYQKKITEPSLN